MNQRRSHSFKGLTDQEVANARARYGENVYQELLQKSLFKRFVENLNDPIIRILLIAMGVNLLFTIKNINWAETLGILLAVLISSIVSTLSEYGSEKVFQRMKEESKRQRINVFRNGEIVQLPLEELVVGDCVLLEAGEKIPADGKMLKGKLLVDQSAVNGESTPVEKIPRNGEKKDFQSPIWLFAGSLVCEGEGVMEVTEVGKESLYGKIAKEIQVAKEDSPLKIRLSKLAKTISRIGYLAAFFVAVAYIFGAFVIDSNFAIEQIALKISNLRFVAVTFMRAITIAMTVIVVAVPEGLPMMITVVLASNMKRMLKDHVLVKRLAGIETAGSINILFTDKTGTLTQGKLCCEELVLGCGERYSRKRSLSPLEKLMIPSLLINNACKYSNGRIIGGNPTDQALYSFLELDKESETPTADEKILFDSSHKFSAAAVKNGIYKGVYFKGAPEKILPYCKSCYNMYGERVSFDQNKMKKLISHLSKGSARIVALSTAESLTSPEKAGEMTFLCIAVLKDTLRSEASSAVETLEKAGIHTVMITGDSKETATGVAKACGILNGKHYLVYESKELEHMSDHELAEKLDALSVVARALPSDKSRLVKLAQKKGLVVGMTGDGINDAPALKKADVGFSMGTGSEIARDAGDIVILDNNLLSISKAVLYGRTIFKSIRKFITFQLTMNLCAVGVSLFGQIIGIESPITVIQMLWVNMIMDTLGGLAFAGEYPLPCYMKEKPIGREEPILSKRMLHQTLIMGGIGTLICSLFLGLPIVRALFQYSESPDKLFTAFFALFIFTGISICFTARSERLNLFAGLSKNKAFLVIMFAILAVQLIMLYYGGETFRCVGLSLRGLLLVTACSLSVIPIDILRRLLLNQKIVYKQKKNCSRSKNKQY